MIDGINTLSFADALKQLQKRPGKTVLEVLEWVGFTANEETLCELLSEGEFVFLGVMSRVLIGDDIKHVRFLVRRTSLLKYLLKQYRQVPSKEFAVSLFSLLILICGCR